MDDALQQAMARRGMMSPEAGQQPSVGQAEVAAPTSGDPMMQAPQTPQEEADVTIAIKALSSFIKQEQNIKLKALEMQAPPQLQGGM